MTRPTLKSVPVPSLVRLPFRELSFLRLLRGGRPNDAGRLPRYIGLFAIGAACIWAPITSYLEMAPLRFTSSMSLILPAVVASPGRIAAAIDQ